MRTIQAINTSVDLAELMNTHTPLTPQDAGETPLDWPGLGLFGPDGLVTYEADREASSATRLVLAGGTVAVDYKTEWHARCPLYKTMPEVSAPHWCPAEHDETTWADADAVVRLDWRSVYVGQGSFSATNVYDSVDEAKAAYGREVAQMEDAFPQDADEDDTDQF